MTTIAKKTTVAEAVLRFLESRPGKTARWSELLDAYVAAAGPHLETSPWSAESYRQHAGMNLLRILRTNCDRPARGVYRLAVPIEPPFTVRPPPNSKKDVARKSTILLNKIEEARREMQGPTEIPEAEVVSSTELPQPTVEKTLEELRADVRKAYEAWELLRLAAERLERLEAKLEGVPKEDLGTLAELIRMKFRDASPEEPK